MLLLSLSLLPGLPPGLPPAAAAPAAVHIAVLAYQGQDAAEADWSPLAAALAEAVPGRSFELRYYTLDGLWQAVERRQVDFVITHGGQYVALESRFGASRIATLDDPRRPGPGRALAAAVVVRADSDLQLLAQLKGRRLAAIDPKAFGGYLVALRELRAAGVEADELASVDFVGFPMQNALHEVAGRRADAAVLRACLLEELARQGLFDAAEFRVLPGPRVGDYPCQISTRLYPDWPFASLRHTDPTLAKAVAAALLAMPPLPGGATWTAAADYQSVHALYRELQLGPYEYLRETTLLAHVKRLWWVLAVAGLLLLGWIVHTVRVEYQVAARTRALRQALEERDKAHARIQAQQDEAEHLSRLSILGEMSGVLAHELNQPLASIANFADSMVRRLEAGRYTPEVLAEASRAIGSEAQRAGGIVRRIRAFARKRTAVRQASRPGDLVHESVDLFCGMLPHPPAITVADTLPPSSAVLGDPLQLQQVLLNLLKNAWDAMQAQPPGERRIDIALRREGGQCLIEVRDHGPGLADEQLARLFEPFFTTKPEGLGLGLSICRSIVEAHAGRLDAERPADGPGLRFRITLPLHDAADRAH